MVLGTRFPALDTAQSEDSTTWPGCNYTVLGAWVGRGRGMGVGLHLESLT